MHTFVENEIGYYIRRSKNIQKSCMIDWLVCMVISFLRR